MVSMVLHGMVWYGMVWYGMVPVCYIYMLSYLHFILTVSTKLYEVEKECLQMELELLNCTNQLKVLERDKVRQDALALDEDLSMPEKLNEKEIQVYKKQCEILGISYDIQDKNEKIVRLDLQGLENSEEMETDLDKGILTKALKIVFRKKAILRNKKVRKSKAL